jgi:hypothetical protein
VTRSLRATLLSAVLVLSGALAVAAEPELHVRVVQIKGSLKRTDKPELDKELEPLRSHLEQAGLDHGKYQLVGTQAQKGAFGKPFTFDVEGGLKATITATAVEDRIVIVLQVDKVDRATKTTELVSRTTLKMKDGATSVQSFAGALAGSDLLLAVTAQRGPF